MNAPGALAACLWSRGVRTAVREAPKQSDEPYEVTINRKGQVTICCEINTAKRGVNLWPQFGGKELLVGIPFDDWQPKHPPDAVTWLGKIEA